MIMAQASILRKSGADDIYIGSVSMTEDLQNKLTKRPKGNKKTNQTAMPTITLKDSKKYLWNISVTGFLLSDSDAMLPTADNKRAALIGRDPLGMLFTAEFITFIHRDREYTGAIEKMQIKEDVKHADKTGGGTSKYEINFTMIVSATPTP